MKIAFVGGFAFSPKGTMRARAHPLAAELARHGNEVTLFLPPYDNASDDGREWEQEGVKIRNAVGNRKQNGTGAKPPRTHLPKSSYPLLLKNLVKAVDTYRADVVHVFKPKGFSGAAGAYFLMKKVPLVLDCDDWEGWGGWNDVKSYPWLVKEYIDIQERWMMRRASAITVASRTLEQRAFVLRAPENSVYYLPNCAASGANLTVQSSVRAVSPSETKRQLGLPDLPTVLFSGHSEEETGVSSFLQCVVRASEKMPVSAVLIGANLTDQTRRDLVLRPQIHVSEFGHLPYEEFLRVVWASDVAVFPYADDPIHRAKCSARILDYMAMGKPILTSAVGQNLEYIVDGESGFLFSPGDDPAMTARLLSLLEDPAMCVRVGTNAEARVRSKFQWSGEALQNCLAAYHHVLN